MYNREEAARLRKRFWTAFGQYMRPVASADGSKVNWLNYHTGIRHVYFRMDAERGRASISIELRQPDDEERTAFFARLLPFRQMLGEALGEEWEWQRAVGDEDGRTISRIGAQLSGVDIFQEADWPAIISFFKPRIVALDRWWQDVKPFVE